jgi:hypothetical protein
LSVLLVAGFPAVTVAITRGRPTPETTALFLFFTDGTLAGCIYDGIVIANGTWCIKGGRWGGELGVEGVEDTDRCRGTAAIFLAFSSVLIVR